MSKSNLKKVMLQSNLPKEIPQSNLSKEILKELLKILSFAEKMTYTTFIFDTKKINQLYLINKFPDLKLGEKKKISFETEKFYIYLIKRAYDFLQTKNSITFDSSYSVLYFKKIIKYLSELIASSIDIVEDNLIKIFFYLLFLFFEEKLNNLSDQNNRKIDLDETFFKGTFIELTEKYSSEISYHDSKEITDFINNCKNDMEIQIIARLENDFLYIKEILEQYRDKKDDYMNEMYMYTGELLYEIEKSFISENIALSNDLINKLNKFYSNEIYLIFTNYISEVERDDLVSDINKKFLESKKDEYLPFEFDYSFPNNSIENEKHNKKLENYLIYRNKNYKKMKYSWFPEVIKLGLDNEFSIFAFSQYKIPTEFNLIRKFKIKIENLVQKNIVAIIKEILYDNDFIELYFSILKCDTIKDFYNNYVRINENDNVFQKQKYQSNDSEIFDEVYSDFMKQYEKKNENYQEFKDLIIYKILPYGDRAYTLKELKKFVINPALFFLGNDLKEDSDIKKMLKGYIMIILLHETEHFLRLLDKNKKVFPITPRQKEGGRLFIKYIFDVYSINHINLEQANKLLNILTWEDHNELKKIFLNQLEDIEEEKGENVDEFLHSYFKDSISFFSNKERKGDNNKKFNLDLYLKK